MASTMNPVDLYHDPSLDGLIHQSDSIRRNNSVRRKSNGHERQPMAANIMPAAPDVPRGPPISYRSPSQDATPQRSFSQRAKGRPFAKEAFADEEYFPPAETNAPYRQAPQNGYNVPQASSSRPPAPVKEDVRVGTERPVEGGSRRNQQRVSSGHSPRDVDGPRSSRKTSETIKSRDQPVSAFSRSSAARADIAAFDDQRRDWAPDRSPLQKLEVTLNDISKEEKRARVQEAEMQLRDAKAKRAVSSGSSTRPKPVVGSSAPRSSSQRQPAPVAETPNKEDAALIRNLSAAQKNRLQHSTVIDNHRPDARRLSGEGSSGFDYSASKPRDATYNPHSASPRGDHDKRSARYSNAPQDPVSRPRRADETVSANRNVSEREPRLRQTVPKPVPSDITRAVSMQDHQPYPQFREDDEDRIPALAERERNASHKATLAKLTGATAPVAVARSGSRKLQKPSPAVLDRERTRPRDMSQPSVPSQAGHVSESAALGTQDENLARSTAVYTPPQQQTSNRDLVGLGVASTSPPTSSPISARTQGDQQQRHRRASVTFKEPAVRRPVDEWKDAQTAKLCLPDFSLEMPSDADKNKAWWESHPDSKSRRKSKVSPSAKSVGASFGDPIDDQTAEFSPRLFLRCGPLLRYNGMKRSSNDTAGQVAESEVWRGSVMIVTQDSNSSYQKPPVLRLFSRPKRLLPPPPAEIAGEELAPEYIDPLAGLGKISRVGRALYVRPVDHLEESKDLSQIENDDGLFESSPSLLDMNGSQGTTAALTNKRTSDQDGEHLNRYQEVQGARLYADPDRDVTFWRFNIEVELSDTQQHVAYRINRGASSSFWVPARGQTMNIMFHSCNGFSTSVKPDQFSGPDPLWRDVLNVHQTRPFHVMIGGGDQIYNDRVRTETQHFGAWTQMRNPHHKHEALFTPEMKEELETFYLNRYAMWFSQGLFGMAASQVPMVNIWDDHDIIDGFGSYPDHFMKSPVFSGVGNVAFKYYMLFQHQSVPEETTAHEPSWVLGHEPGPYINQLSRSLFMNMGKHVAFLGVDCRTERMRDEILSIRTFDLLLERCRKEVIEGETKHLIVLLGVPIAYPRLVWLENVLTSRALDPIKALGRAGVLKSGFLNTFDGGVEILDDLDDHWTASHHKKERNDLIKDLQDLAAEKSVRITILGGDVHLAAIGQFYSNPKLKIPKDKDHRYMPNVISSAIVNTPPPDMMADVINKRDKVHHLDKYTDENMIPMFTHDVDHKKRNNTHLLPRRNWCSIREYVPGSTPPPSPPSTPSMSEDEDDDMRPQDTDQLPKRRFSFSREDVNPRGLLRRLSSRKAPPSSYRDTMPQGNGQQLRSASYDGQPTRGSLFGKSNASGSQRASFDSQDPQRRAASFDHIPSGARSRPGMLRRPTNLSEKAAKKGNVPAIDADGNEIDVHGQVNLEGGLDIVLNVEVNKKDPAGITTPYRLLVPALWYDGSSDREKLESSAGIHRKPTLLGRFGIGGGRRIQKAAQNQGEGNWGQEMSDSESYAGSEDMQQKQQQPKRRFSLFGNRRRKQEDVYSDDESDFDDQPSAKQPFVQEPVQQAPPQNSPRWQVSATLSAPHPLLDYDTGRRQPQSARAALDQHDLLYDTSNRPPSQHLSQPTPPGPPKRSLTITSQKPRANPQRSVSDNYAIQSPTSPPQNPNHLSAYEQQTENRNQNRFNIPPQSYQQPPPHSLQAPAQPSTTIPQRRLSKQERILGLGAGDTNNQYNLPGSQPLRGNGIIGHDAQENETSPKGYGGYGGIDAWKEPKPKRGFSLKKARDWFDGRGGGADYDESEGGGGKYY